MLYARGSDLYPASPNEILGRCEEEGGPRDGRTGCGNGVGRGYRYSSSSHESRGSGLALLK
jgi:hypothetical protein